VNYLGRKPEECWFIDDKRSNVQGARLAGLIGHHFRHVEDLAHDARQLGFEI
jgi:FMN phosphatase YigB (HAD superfamily)